jgi:hypothetical protein
VLQRRDNEKARKDEQQRNEQEGDPPPGMVGKGSDRGGEERTAP